MIDDLDNAIAHIEVAILQSIPADDQIIMDHVRNAHSILIDLRNAVRRGRA
jgi:hypothetical protein